MTTIEDAKKALKIAKKEKTVSAFKKAIALHESFNAGVEYSEQIVVPYIKDGKGFWFFANWNEIILTDDTKASEKKDKKAVMTRAWVIAKAAAAKFGGKASQYLSGALKAAWAE